MSLIRQDDHRAITVRRTKSLRTGTRSGPPCVDAEAALRIASELPRSRSVRAIGTALPVMLTAHSSPDYGELRRAVK